MAKTGEWAQPPGRPVLDDAAYYGLIGDMVDYVIDFTEADKALLLVSLLCFIGVMAGSGAAVCPNGMTDEPLLLYPLAIGDSYYGRKDTAVKALKHYMMAADPDFWRQNISTDLTSERGVAEKIRDDSGKKNDDEELIHDGKEDKRLLLVVAEFEKVMDQMANPMTKLGPTIRTLWDGTDVYIDTGKPVKVTRPHVGMHFSVQGEVFAEKYSPTQAAGGTFSRIIPVYTHRSKEYSATELPEVAKATMKRFGEKLGGILSRFRDKHGDDNPHVFALDEEAQKYWDDELHSEFTRKPSGASGFTVQFISRRADYLLRIAAIYALIDEKLKIGMRHLKAALAVMAYILDTVKYVEEEFEIRPMKASRTDQEKSFLADLLIRVAANGIARTALTDVHFKKNKEKVDFLLEHVPHKQATRRNGNAKRLTTYYYAPEFAPEDAV